MFKFRTIIEDYETHLRIVDSVRAGAAAKGKSEWERYGNGEIEFSVRLRNVAIQNDSALNVYIEKQFIGQIIINNGSGKVRNKSKNGDFIPAVTVGTKLFIYLDSTLVFEGIFVKD